MSLFLSLAALAAVDGTPCAHSPAAPDEPAARRIAERVIASRPRRGIFTLIVEPDRDAPGYWRAYQSAGPTELGSGMRGGGGLQMRISRCTGRVDDISYQR